MRTPLWACLALVVSAGDDFDTHAAGDHFDTHAHFFSARDGQTLESLPVRARTVRAGGSRLGEDGFRRFAQLGSCGRRAWRERLQWHVALAGCTDRLIGALY